MNIPLASAFVGAAILCCFISVLTTPFMGLRAIAALGLAFSCFTLGALTVSES